MAFCYMIGISGDYFSGKTLLAEGLAASYSNRTVQVVQMDSYLKVKPNSQCIDRYTPESYDLEKMQKTVFDIIEQRRCRILIVEGPFTFAYKPLEELCDIRVFVECSEEERLRRQSQLKGNDSFSDEYVRRCYTEYIEPSRQEADLFVSSDESLEREVWQIRKALRGLFL